LIRSKRKTVAIYILPDAKVQVRAPLRLPQSDIDRFVNQKAAWIARNVERMQSRLRQSEQEQVQTSPEEQAEQIARMKILAKEILPQRTAHYAGMMGVEPKSVRISNAEKRWGSCSSKGNINFSWRLMLVSEEARDYVVVHELAHLMQMNHSERFWAIVERILPDWRARKNSLRVSERYSRLT
jgi:predicted metal-dependent hydrolase